MCWCTPAMRTPKCHRLDCKPFVHHGVDKVFVVSDGSYTLTLDRDQAIRTRDELNAAFPAKNSMQVRDEMLADRYGRAPA